MKQPTRLSIAALLLSLWTGIAAADAVEPERKSLEREALEHFQALLRIDTSAGHESKVVDYLRGVLEQEGIPVRAFHRVSERESLVARLEGSGEKDPILIMAHTDVVPVDYDRWFAPSPEGDETSRPKPFAGTKQMDRDGRSRVYGRGSLDDKPRVAAGLMVMLMLKRADVSLDRDVIFFAEAGEEGSPSIGAKFMVDEHFEEIDAEFCFAEGGHALLRESPDEYQDPYKSVVVKIDDKLGYRLEVKAEGTAGHGSAETPNNSIAALSRAVAAIYDHQRSLGRDKAEAPRTTLSPTIVETYNRSINIIPAEATASFDMRAVPDEVIEEYIESIQERVNKALLEKPPIIARVTVSLGERETRPKVDASKTSTPAYRAIENAVQRHYQGVSGTCSKLDDEGCISPKITSASTDMNYLRDRGVQCYGIGPALEPGDLRAGYVAHGNGERILEDEFYRYIRFLYDIVTELAVAD